jgi:phospholipase B1
MSLLSFPFPPRIIPRLIPPRFQCALLDGEIGRATRKAMDVLQEQYNDRLLRIVSDYQRARHPTFAVTYVNAKIPFEELPSRSLSNVDCFHPSLDTHRFIAAEMWNRLTGDKTARSQPFTPWTRDLRFRCLEEGDRIITDTLIR